MQQLETYKDAQTFLVNCVEELLEGYEFKFTNILDNNGRCIPNTNRIALHQLQKAFWRFKEVETWHKKQNKEQKDDT